ncbi:conjugal transfer protein TraX [Lachnospiraceae bacterium OttesenSCG-928-D06]|nr:conjugal transfer protein TraX [Lachnospiraceae bacterium OttesenSCG-928-D06]
MNKIRKMNAFQIKLLMSLLMLLDHLRGINNLISPEMASIFTLVSRCVAPMFAYFAVEGIRHTRNLKKYCLRLSILAGVMFGGNAILRMIFRSIDNNGMFSFMSGNVIFTLALGVFAIALLKWGKEKKMTGRWSLNAVSIICFIIGFFWGEWGTVLLPFMFIEYFWQDKKVIRFLGYGMIEIIAILLPFGEPFYFLVFPFMLLYNGEYGPKTSFNKYFFYIFYPAHLWIIGIINIILVSI